MTDIKWKKGEPPPAKRGERLLLIAALTGGMRTTLVAWASAFIGLVYCQSAGAFPVGAPMIKQAAMVVSDVKQAKTGGGAAADSRTAVRAEKS